MGGVERWGHGLLALALTLPFLILGCVLAAPWAMDIGIYNPALDAYTWGYRDEVNAVFGAIFIAIALAGLIGAPAWIARIRWSRGLMWVWYVALAALFAGVLPVIAVVAPYASPFTFDIRPPSALFTVEGVLFGAAMAFGARRVARRRWPVRGRAGADA